MNKTINKNGKFLWHSNADLFLPLIGMIAFAILSAWFGIKVGYISVGFLAVISALLIYDRYRIYRKKYRILFPLIQIMDGHSCATVVIPDNYSIIISPLEFPVAMYQYGTYIRNEVACISVVTENDRELLIAKLHQNNPFLYTNWSIMKVFQSDFIESFAYDMALPFELWKNARHVVIAESVKDLISVCGNNVVYDLGY